MLKWMLVVKVEGGKNNKYMVVLKNEEAVLDHVGQLEEHQEMERLFTVDEFGNVFHKIVIFDGRLKIVDKGTPI